MQRRHPHHRTAVVPDEPPLLGGPDDFSWPAVSLDAARHRASIPRPPDQRRHRSGRDKRVLVMSRPTIDETSGLARPPRRPPRRCFAGLISSRFSATIAGCSRADDTARRSPACDRRHSSRSRRAWTAAGAVATPGLAPLAPSPCRTAADAEDAAGEPSCAPTAPAAPARRSPVAEPDTEARAPAPDPRSSNGAGYGPLPNVGRRQALARLAPVWRCRRQGRAPRR